LKSPVGKIERVQRERKHPDRSTGLIGTREKVKAPSAKSPLLTESAKVPDRSD
jgi:hypothetical protein